MEKVITLDITPSIPVDRQIIQTYGNFSFKVNDIIHQNPIIVMQSETIQWSVERVEDLVVGCFSEIIQARPAIEILLIGCGRFGKIIEPDKLAYLREAQITVEPMDTGAACRTFNVLMAEDRRVAAALIPVG